MVGPVSDSVAERTKPPDHHRRAAGRREDRPVLAAPRQHEAVAVRGHLAIPIEGEGELRHRPERHPFRVHRAHERRLGDDVLRELVPEHERVRAGRGDRRVAPVREVDEGDDRLLGQRERLSRPRLQREAVDLRLHAEEDPRAGHGHLRRGRVAAEDRSVLLHEAARIDFHEEERLENRRVDREQRAIAERRRVHERERDLERGHERARLREAAAWVEERQVERLLDDGHRPDHACVSGEAEALRFVVEGEDLRVGLALMHAPHGAPWSGGL